MKNRSLLICLSILVMFFAGCSSQSSADLVAEEVARQVQAAEDARAAAEQAKATQQALANAEQTLAVAEQALAAAKQQAQQAKTAEARAKAEAEQLKLAEQARIAADEARRLELEREARLLELEERRRKAQLAAKQADTRKPTAAQKPADPQKPTATQITLAAGTPIRVITGSEISTQTSDTGDGFTVILNEDISHGGRVIARRGAIVGGVVSESDPGGRVRGVATISLRLNNLPLSDGGQASISTNEYSADAPSAVGKNVATGAVATGLGAAIGAIAGGGRGAVIGAGAGAAAGTGVALATQGYPAVIPSETIITFNLTAPLTVGATALGRP
jgi:septum formation inhibitor MinC